MKCLVTGPSGFIGSAVCEALTAAGCHVTVLVRQPGSVPASLPHVVHDLRQPLSEAFSLRGMDVVVHTAGIAHQKAAPAQHVAVNEAATVALARRAARDGVGRFVFLSSVKAMGPAPGAAPRSETQLCTPAGSYAVSKRRAEIALSALADETTLELVTLRPALVYGAGVGGNLGSLLSWVRRGLPLVPEAGARSMVSRDDLVRLIVTLVACDAGGLPATAALWNVTDGEAYSTRRLMLALAAALQRPPPTRSLPAAAWRVLGACADLARAMPAGTTAAALLESELYDGRAVSVATGWRPRQRFEDVAPAIVDTAAAS